ncbi:uncharacterized protein N7484_005356 [Penicillium longicatenatum]|uniref:uncharacterized protein n=1 Tax=Penicillium longicatenatum TaxID=1561947 RepID=UPI0025484B30|nr:uncharacterized protein N7484_005356 [Penicillium longicatenatum]KAJ5651633.1 hypothetical protein N7484_005356 [Penicillium longicatenatum]
MSAASADVELSDQAPGNESDTSGVSFRPEDSDSDVPDGDQVGGSTTQTSPEPSRSSEQCGGVSCSSKHSVRSPIRSRDLPDFSDDPDDDTDEDIANVPLDYGRSEKTKVRGVRIEQRWQKYCRVKAKSPDASLKWNDPTEALRQVTPNDVHRFLNYCLKLKYGQDGRHLKGTNKASSLKADWKSFCGYFRRITRTRISPEDREEINAGIRLLIDKWELDQQERGKEPVYVQDLTELNETILRTQERRFHFGYERIQMCLFSMIGIYTVNRLSALLSLQLKHLQFSIQKDPQGGPPVLLAEIKSEHTKRFLGSEAINTFPFPEIIDDPSLIFSPHVFIFGILFWLQAFESPALSSMERLRSLFVQGGRQQMQLPLKPEVEDHYIFCKTQVTNGYPILRWDQPMLDVTMSARLRSLGEIHGWLHSMFAHLSEAQQNLIMKHADSRTFLNHYLPRHIDTDMQNVMNGRDSNKSLMRAITRMSRWIDTRRPRHLTAEQRASIREHPEYVEAVQRFDEQAEVCIHDPSEQMRSRRDKLARDKLNTFGRLERALRQKIRKEFDRKQANIDIERQLSGAAIDDEEAKNVLRTDSMLPEQINLLEKLFTWPTSHSLDAEWQRRNAAVVAISQYCGHLEGGPLRGRRKRTAPSDDTDEEQRTMKLQSLKTVPLSPEVSQEELLLEKAGKYIRKAKKPRRCFQCYGDAQLPVLRRTQKYSEYKSTLRHFRKCHLKDRRCHMCSEDLLHEMHLRRHAEDVHRLATERNYYAKQEKEESGSDIDTD